MGRSLLDKVLTFMGVFEYEDEVRSDEEGGTDAKESSRETGKKNRSRLVSITGGQKLSVIVVEPVRFEEAKSIADHIKDRKPVIVRLDGVEHDLAKRIVDFVSGTTYALDGSMQRIGEGIFLFAPINIYIEADVNTNLKEEGFLWKEEETAAGRDQD